MENRFVSGNNLLFEIYDAQKTYKEWHIMLGLHLVMATLHGWFTMRIVQDKRNWWH